MLESDQCAACGKPDSAAWTLWIASDQLEDAGIRHRATFRLCTSHKERLMDWMAQTPDHDPARPLRGYT